jgi:ubiquinone/menaquinone biosynthesis C-methylase UbiE
MQLSAAISLIQHPVTKKPGRWADLGCGDGLFTLALSHLLPEGSFVYAIDTNRNALRNVTVRDGIQLEKFALNFVEEDLPVNGLSGILMANSFHFVYDKTSFIKKVFESLLQEASIIIIEYDMDRSNAWVPYPISFNALKKFFDDGNMVTEKIHALPSRFNEKIYAAVIRKKG